MDPQHARTTRPGRRQGRALRAAAVAAAVALVALGGGSSPTPLEPLSYTDPAPPSNVVLTPADRALGVSWSPSPEPGVLGYRVWVDGAPGPIVQGTSTTLTGLVNGRSYVITVRAGTQLAGTTYEGTTASSPVTGVPKDAVAPARPTGVTAARGDGQVRVGWVPDTADYDADGYRVLRDGTPVSGLVAGRGTTSWTDTGLVNDTTYSYTVQTHDTSGNWSASAAPAASATPTDLTAPLVPTGLAAERRDREVRLVWNAGPETDIAVYRLFRDGLLLAEVAGTQHVDAGLTNDQLYRYTLVAVDTHGNASAATAPAVTATPTDLTAPATPTGLTAARGDGEVTLQWAANGEGDLARYRVLRGGLLVAEVTGTRYVDAGLTNDQPYAYTLVAVDTHGNASLPSDPAVTATPTDLTAPAAPTGLAATAGDSEVALGWDPGPEPDVARYRLYRDGVLVAEVTGTEHVDAGLTNGTGYAWTLVAVDAHGNPSPPSDEVTATPTDQTPPAVPADVVASVGDGQAVVRWSPVADADLAGYRVLAADGTVLAVVAAPGTEAVLSGLADDVEQVLTVVAVDVAGNVSAPSAAVPVTPVARPVPVLGSGESGGLAVSADGRFVVVGTRARLEPTDTNTAAELHLVDRAAGTARRIAPLPATATAADSTNAAAPAISDDGRYVALATTAALVSADTNRAADVYRLDTRTGTWALVSVPAGGKVSTIAGTVLHTGPSVYATSPTVVMSADGDLVAFYSARADLGPRDTNAVADVYAKRMSTGSVTRVSATATGTDLPRTVLGPALVLTPDGRTALFPATSSTGTVVLYRATLTGTGVSDVRVVSSVLSGGRATEFSVFRDVGDVDLSDDGRYVALVTSAKLGTTTPTASWTTGLAYRLDTVTGSVVPLGDGQRTAWEHQVALDPTGRYAFFATVAPAVPGDGNGHTDHLRRDLDGGVAGPLVLVTADAAGAATTGVTGSIVAAEYGRLVPISGDRVLVTTSQALLPADTNRLRDLYAKDLTTGGVRSVVG